LVLLEQVALSEECGPRGKITTTTTFGVSFFLIAKVVVIVVVIFPIGMDG
jgi:hypothetical protein